MTVSGPRASRDELIQLYQGLATAADAAACREELSQEAAQSLEVLRDLLVLAHHPANEELALQATETVAAAMQLMPQPRSFDEEPDERLLCAVSGLCALESRTLARPQPHEELDKLVQSVLAEVPTSVLLEAVEDDLDLVALGRVNACRDQEHPQSATDHDLLSREEFNLLCQRRDRVHGLTVAEVLVLCRLATQHNLRADRIAWLNRFGREAALYEAVREGLPMEAALAQEIEACGSELCDEWVRLAPRLLARELEPDALVPALARLFGRDSPDRAVALLDQLMGLRPTRELMGKLGEALPRDGAARRLVIGYLEAAGKGASADQAAQLSQLYREMGPAGQAKAPLYDWFGRGLSEAWRVEDLDAFLADCPETAPDFVRRVVEAGQEAAVSESAAGPPGGWRRYLAAQCKARRLREVADTLDDLETDSGPCLSEAGREELHVPVERNLLLSLVDRLAGILETAPREPLHIVLRLKTDKPVLRVEFEMQGWMECGPVAWDTAVDCGMTLHTMQQWINDGTATDDLLRYIADRLFGEILGPEARQTEPRQAYEELMKQESRGELQPKDVCLIVEGDTSVLNFPGDLLRSPDVGWLHLHYPAFFRVNPSLGVRPPLTHLEAGRKLYALVVGSCDPALIEVTPDGKLQAVNGSGSSQTPGATRADLRGLEEVVLEIEEIRNVLSSVPDLVDVTVIDPAICTFELVRFALGLEQNADKVRTETNSQVVDRIQERLGQWGLLHLSGHAVAHVGKQGQLAAAMPFKTQGGDKEKLLPADDFRVAANTMPRLKFVFLNACLSAAGGLPAGLQVSDSLGFFHSLMQGGVPSLLGYRWMVRDDSAKRFAEVFYQNLLQQGKSIPVSVLAARNATKTLGDAWASAMLVHQEFFEQEAEQ